MDNIEVVFFIFSPFLGSRAVLITFRKHHTRRNYV